MWPTSVARRAPAGGYAYPSYAQIQKHISNARPLEPSGPHFLTHVWPASVARRAPAGGCAYPSYAQIQKHISNARPLEPSGPHFLTQCGPPVWPAGLRRASVRTRPRADSKAHFQCSPARAERATLLDAVWPAGQWSHSMVTQKCQTATQDIAIPLPAVAKSFLLNSLRRFGATLRC